MCSAFCFEFQRQREECRDGHEISHEDHNKERRETPCGPGGERGLWEVKWRPRGHGRDRCLGFPAQSDLQAA